jgi:RNA polymerase sigma-70 factor (ECF subfamily)
MEHEDLIKKCRAGDAAAFAELYDIYSEKIFRYIKLKIQNSHQAEDILQDTFIKAWQALPKFETKDGNFNAWLYKIAGNAINDYFRKLYRSPQALELNESADVAAGGSLAREVEVLVDMENVRQALNVLPLISRQVLELRFIQEFSIKETADILGKSGLAVRLIQHRGLKQLRELLKKDNEPEYSKI